MLRYGEPLSGPSPRPSCDVLAGEYKTHQGIECPREVIEALHAWVKHGAYPGAFLESVLCNDLAGAARHADRWHALRLVAIVGYVQSQLPCGCHGSAEEVEQWRQMHRERDAERLRCATRQG